MTKGRTRAQISTAAIERMYITMRHLFNRGFYKPMGVSGETLREALLELRPEIYGSIAEEKTELNGLTYVLERLPEGIEECVYINLTSEEGYDKAHFEPIIPEKRRRNCYRIDQEQMNIEITRGRSEIYDILTHLTFLYVESEKIRSKVLIPHSKKVIRPWEKIEEAISKTKISVKERETTLVYVANILGRSFDEIYETHQKFATDKNPDKFIKIVYWLGKLAINEVVTGKKRAISFSPLLRERLGHHIHGEIWANDIKKVLQENQLLQRPIHIISANMHSVMNTLYASKALPTESKKANNLYELYEQLSAPGNKTMRNKVEKVALKEGMIYIPDHSGTNINVQIFDTAKVDWPKTQFAIDAKQKEEDMPVLFVMDYAFGEQAYETIDEFLKPYKEDQEKTYLDVVSVNIMGKAGILEGGKGDLMIPSAHIYEGTADNYPFKNELCAKDFEGEGLQVFEGAMISVLGTSLQNKDILRFFYESTWNVIGLEMEGAHYQKAVQSASKIRKSIREDVKVSYAYYASDNPLETGSTLASGGLGITGVKPTYLITDRILKQIFNVQKT
ncbi:MAG: hypothetical protein OIF50_07590 [Flavobacteriaceae bacterium]|nr:hypothetical protein [Flavobacteriaceae bacterium]